MAGVDQKQMCSRVDALLSERLAFAQQEFTEELWRIGDDFNAKGMLGGSAFSHAVLRFARLELLGGFPKGGHKHRVGDPERLAGSLGRRMKSWRG